MSLSDKRLLEHKQAEVAIERIERLLSMSRAERRANGVRIPREQLQAMLDREQMRLSAP